MALTFLFLRSLSLEEDELDELDSDDSEDMVEHVDTVDDEDEDELLLDEDELDEESQLEELDESSHPHPLRLNVSFFSAFRLFSVFLALRAFFVVFLGATVRRAYDGYESSSDLSSPLPLLFLPFLASLLYFLRALLFCLSPSNSANSFEPASILDCIIACS